jgi:hypothetical protein
MCLAILAWPTRGGVPSRWVGGPARKGEGGKACPGRNLGLDRQSSPRARCTCLVAVGSNPTFQIHHTRYKGQRTRGR